MVQWCMDNSCPLDTRSVREAVYHGRDAVFFFSSRITFPWISLRIMRLLQQDGARPSRDSGVAASGGMRRRLGLLLQGDISVSSSWGTYKRTRTATRQPSRPAARFGRLELVEYLYIHGCPWDVRTCMMAAGKGHLNVVKWLRCVGCPWNAGTSASAAANGRLDVLKWCQANGCP